MIAWWCRWMVAAAAEPCGEELAADPEGREAWRCWYQQARRSGDYERARRALEAHLAEHPACPAASLSLGAVAGDRGDPDARSWFELALPGYPPPGEDAARARLSYASFLVQEGDLDRADALLQEAAQAASSDPLLLATVQAQGARVAWKRGDPRGEVLARLTPAERVAFPDGPYPLQLLVLHVQSAALTELGRWEEARVAGDRLIAINRQAGDRYVLATSLLNQASLLEEPTLAASLEVRRALLREAVDAGQEGGNPFALAGASCLLVWTEPWPAARAWVQPCLDAALATEDPVTRWTALEEMAVVLAPHEPAWAGRLVAQLKEETRDARWPDRSAAAYVELLVDTAGSGRLDPASAERVLGPIEAGIAADPDPAAVAPWAFVYQRLAGLSLGDPAQPAQLGRALWFHERLRAGGSLPADLPDPESLVGALQQVLGPRERIVTWLLADRDTATRTAIPSWVAWIGPESVEVRALPSGSGLGAAARALRDLEGEDNVAFRALLAQLVAQLALPAPSDVDTWLVVPDGPLADLPWSSLPDRAEAVGLSPSLRQILAWRRGPPVRPGVVAVVDPPAPGLARLPGARAEGQALVAALGGTLAAGPAARRRALGAAGPGLIHLGVHATETHDPDSARLWLADGAYDRASLASWPVRDRLVVLAACAAAEGAALPRIGRLGFPEALVQSGARGVVASRAPLRDDEAAALVADLGRGLAAGRPIGRALASAVQAQQRAGAPPRVWATWRLLGDPAATVARLPPPGRIGWWGALLGLLPGLGLAWWLRPRAPGGP